MSESAPYKVSRKSAKRVHEFFDFWFEWFRAPARRRVTLELTGLPESGSTILHRLGYSGPTSVIALARSLSLNQSTVSRQLEPLRAAGLVDEEPYENNRRSTRVSISDRGRAVNEREAAYWLEYWTRVMTHLTEAEQENLAAMLGRLKEAINAEEAAFDEDASRS